MSMVAGRQLSRLFVDTVAKNYAKCVSSLRFNSQKTNNGKVEAAVLKKFGDPLVLEHVEPPKITKPNEVLIDVNCCALNGPDVLISQQLYHQEVKLPCILGYEVCGKILEVGNDAKTAGYKVGDKVIALNKENLGGLSDQCVAEIENTWQIPNNIGSVDAVCLLDNYMTALLGLETYGNIGEDDMVLVNVGIGGFGLAAVDIAANVFLAKVIGVGFSEERADKIRERGAFHAFTYKEKRLFKEVEEIAKERGIKDIYEGQAGEHFKKVLRGFTSIYQSRTPAKHLFRDNNFGVVVQHLSRESRIIIAGLANIKPESERSEADKDFYQVNGISLKDFKESKNDLYRQAGNDVVTFFEEGLIKPAPAMVAGLHKVNEAFKFLSDMKAIGKVVIDIKNKDEEAKVKA